MIAPALRAEAHLGIGRLLAANIPAETREEAIFEIVNHLNRGAALITAPDEREQVAEFNLIAGKRAKASTAYASALRYLVAGAALLPKDPWERRHDLMFALELERAECEFLTGELAAADERLAVLSKRTANTVERASIACLHIDVCTTLDQSGRAVAVALDYLRQVGIEWSPHPTEGEARQEYEQISLQLGSRTIEDVFDLPLMSDLESLATVDVLTKVVVPAFFTDRNLGSLTICRAVNLSLDRGNCDASCRAYVMLASIAGPRFGDHQAGFRFGQVGYELVERRGLKRFQASIYDYFAIWIARWTKHVRCSSDLLRRSFETANEIGDLTFAAYAAVNLISDLLFAGDPLNEVQGEAELGLAFAQKARFGLVADGTTTQLALIRTLRGLTPKFGCFDGEQIEEFPFESHLAGNQALAIAECWYWVRKLQARYFAGDYQEAMEASSKAERLLWTSPALFEEAEYHFYSALSRAACCGGASTGERQQHLECLAAHQRQLTVWTENCRENFENRLALVSAEIARIEGRPLEAMDLYERAIVSARENGFVHNEALAYELAARFYAARGFETTANAYLREARSCYLRWGADGKVRQLDQLHPHLRPDERAPGPTGTIEASVEQLDLATVIKVSQAVIGEMALEKLIDGLMRAAIEHAGAERGLLITSPSEELRTEAEATTCGDDVIVLRPHDARTASVLPEALVRYAMRTQQAVILDDASSQNPFIADPYIVRHRARSILCLPLTNQGKLIGILYLENNLTPKVFTPDRVTVLKLLASQAAISLENTRLYRDLEDREGKIRRLVDANVIGIFIADLEGRVIEANDAFLRIVGYDRADLVSGRLRWTELTPPEWRERDTHTLAELSSTGTVQPFEKEYFRKDGSRVPVLIGAALFKEGGTEGVAFVLDLTERKRAEEAVRELESHFAHTNRVSMMGELAASLSHEIAQPIASARNNARAALNFLEKQPPDLGEIREALACVVGDADRARDIVDRIREHIQKAPPRKERFDLNAAINEVIVLARSAIIRNGVSVQTHLADGLFPVQGDRVQLQQVVLNLILNAVEAMGSVEAGIRELFISTEQGHTGVLVAVRDSGPGIDPEHLERVFEAFFTTKSSGVGMGLSICRSIISAHGGRLWADSNEPCGAVFQFTLPGT
jgi:PAS domain S-box-containing protein